MPISKIVWGKGWQREAAETQATSAGLAAFIRKLEMEGLAADADIFLRAAMKHGARNAKAIILGALRGWRARREASTWPATRSPPRLSGGILAGSD